MSCIPFPCTTANNSTVVYSEPVDTLSRMNSATNTQSTVYKQTLHTVQCTFSTHIQVLHPVTLQDLYPMMSTHLMMVLHYVMSTRPIQQTMATLSWNPSNLPLILPSLTHPLQMMTATQSTLKQFKWTLFHHWLRITMMWYKRLGKRSPRETSILSIAYHNRQKTVTNTCYSSFVYL